MGAEEELVFDAPPEDAFGGHGRGSRRVMKLLVALAERGVFESQREGWIRLGDYARSSASTTAADLRRGRMPGGSGDPERKRTPGRFDARWAPQQDNPKRAYIWVRYLGPAE